jgi:alkaline phosphatase D
MRYDPTELLRADATRRQFLARAAGLVAMGTLGARRADATLRQSSYPFTLGVASGDPSPTGVVLWTRLAPDPLLGGGMPWSRVAVRWELARDEGFRQVVRRGSQLAIPELGHSVHVEVDGLEPGRHYWYRFMSGGEASRVGRTRTAPAAGRMAPEMNFAFASCQRYDDGLFTAYRHMADEDLDLVVHLGDYIYEYAARETNPVRAHIGTEIQSLAQYRNRYALYKLDPDLRAAHAAFPFVVTFDDHEVENNWAGDIPEAPPGGAVFLQRRAAAFQAFYEHMPLRRTSMPRGPDIQVYRRLPYGGLAQFHVLDTRQYRTDQPCGDGNKPLCDAAFDPAATITGAEQERWLMRGLRESRTRWNILAHQLPITQVDEAPGPEMRFSMDKWDAYIRSRQRLFEFLAPRPALNTVFITGDVHVNWAADLKEDFYDPNSRTLGVEFVGTSISTGGDGSDVNSSGVTRLAENPHFRFYNSQRGYVRCKLTPERWTTDYRVVPFVTAHGAPISTRKTLVVENGRPGIVS